MSDQPEQQQTWRERLATWWKPTKAAVRNGWEWIKPGTESVLIACVVALSVAGGVLIATKFWARTAIAWAEQAQQLDARITALEAAQAATPAETAPLLAPVRPRAPAARAAPTPTEPAPPTAAWSQPTDLDRAIDRFSTNLQESTQ